MSQKEVREMFYAYDNIYGVIELPDLIKEIIDTPLVQRLKGISQDVLPKGFLPWKIPSRFEHSLGVVYLINQTLKYNTELPEKTKNLLLIAALLHDAGNPCLSHLSEPFLYALTGKDGELFLEETLYRDILAKSIIKELDINIATIIKMVTGQEKPISDILNGSMDLDNVDNVIRYWQSANPESANGYNAVKIAQNFHFSGHWFLPQECAVEAIKWQEARQNVYSIVYGNPKLNAAMMVYRALAIAFHRGLVEKDFFRLNDTDAINYLKKSNEQSCLLIERAASKQYHTEEFSLETKDPSKKLQDFAKKWNARTLLADQIAKECCLHSSDICCYVGAGRDKRRIKIPFKDADIEKCIISQDVAPIYRIKVYLAPLTSFKVGQVQSVMKKIV